MELLFLSRIRMMGILAAVLLFSCVCIAPAAAGQEASSGLQQETPPMHMAEGSGYLIARVIVVSENLSLHPVPKRRFRIYGGSLPIDGLVTNTDFDGVIKIVLPAGEYEVGIQEPLKFEGREFSWNIRFSVSPGTTTSIELSNDNSQVRDLKAPIVTEIRYNEGDLYRRYKNSVFKVISEGGHGSGFLVDSSGLVLTNHHVVRDSDYLAVKVDENRKYEAVLVAEDPNNDLAILWISNEAVDGLEVLTLAEGDRDDPPVSVGERVLAIGSPLATETILTTGIVSKVEADVIYSDVSINPGNSGGPLFDSRGRVVGVNTFGLGTSSGPGVSGIVRIFLGSNLIERARADTNGLVEPSDRLLAVESSYRFPASVVREAALRGNYNQKGYHLECGKFDLQFITPRVIASLEVQEELAASTRQKKRTKKRKQAKANQYTPGRDFYNWRQYAGQYRPVVAIQAMPEIKLTGASTFAVIMIGNYADRQYRFKADFIKMELKRGGHVVEPIWPGRIREVVSFQSGKNSMDDIGTWGKYEYPPEAFRPGEQVYLYLWHSNNDQPKIVEIKQPQLQLIWSDFSEYFESLQEAVSR